MNNQKRTFNPLLKRQTRYQQAENAKLKYIGNWGPAIQGTTISSSEWTLEDGNATLSSEANTTTQTSVFIDGTPGENTIVNKVTLANGEINEHILKLRITDNDIPYINDDYWG